MDNIPSRKERSHERIVDAAARSIRRNGYDGVGVADVMEKAGLTHGGFYAHFASREALLVEALEQAGRESSRRLARNMESLRARGAGPFEALVESYLSDDLLKANGSGCPVAALCSEMPRQTPEVRRASAIRVRALVTLIETTLPPTVPYERAPLIAASMMGSLQLARMIGTVEQGKALLASARAGLIEQYAR
jgi:TetR/AcrR family transcriptional regulator, transcriptional repressor for nem operon